MDLEESKCFVGRQLCSMCILNTLSVACKLKSSVGGRPVEGNVSSETFAQLQ